MTSQEIQDQNNPQILHERLSSPEIRKAERRLIKLKLARLHREKMDVQAKQSNSTTHADNLCDYLPDKW